MVYQSDGVKIAGARSQGVWTMHDETLDLLVCEIRRVAGHKRLEFVPNRQSRGQIGDGHLSCVVHNVVLSAHTMTISYTVVYENVTVYI